MFSRDLCAFLAPRCSEPLRLRSRLLHATGRGCSLWALPQPRHPQLSCLASSHSSELSLPEGVFAWSWPLPPPLTRGLLPCEGGRSGGLAPDSSRPRRQHRSRLCDLAPSWASLCCAAGLPLVLRGVVVRCRPAGLVELEQCVVHGRCSNSWSHPPPSGPDSPATSCSSCTVGTVPLGCPRLCLTLPRPTRSGDMPCPCVHRGPGAWHVDQRAG